MPVSLNEIRTRAAIFSREWANAYDEDAEAKSFWDGFFRVFGQERRQVAMFEKFVKKLNDKQGFIDLFWPGKLVVEHKSKGKNLDKAFDQATEYFTGLKTTEYPKYIIVSDFARIRLYDLDNDNNHEITLAELPEKVELFKFIAGYEQAQYKEQDPANIEAAELMGKLHDAMLATGYEGHQLEVYLVRLLFCLFAEDSNIFEKYQFQSFIEDRTHEDGSDLGAKLTELFYVLNTEPRKRLKNLDEQLSAFAYVNGKLFEEMLPPASFDRKMRDQLLDCCSLDWSRISPAIFGSLFQSVMDKDKRRNLGAHYTSEKNILKLIKPLFLDNLIEEFETIKGYKSSAQRNNALNKFHLKIAGLRFLDPACGCGNFLIVSYRELRLLELEIIKELQGLQFVTDISTLVLCDVGQFYGIEIEEFPSQIAQVALWLMDHQMNLRVSDMFGLYFVRLPLRSRPHITNANALRIEWQRLIEPMSWEKKKSTFDYILGNPPFLGKHLQSDFQKQDMEVVFRDVASAGLLDFVAAWYLLAAKYVTEFSNDSQIKVAFVSTNSVTQGEQVSVLWSELFNKYKIKIHFAHRTFKWGNEARGNAAVHVVIIGFSNFDIGDKLLFDYPENSIDPIRTTVKNINPYLVSGNDLVVSARTNPICSVPKMVYGSKPVDDGNFFLTDEEKEKVIKIDSVAAKFIKPILSSHEFLNGENRWCIWLDDANPSEYQKSQFILKRLNAIREFRQKSTKASVRKQAETPQLFSEIRQPKDNYVIIPIHSSENRKYIPFGFFNSNIIVSNSCMALPSATLFHFGIITSELHNTWIKYTCGRIKSDYRYSNLLVYNNFPWPEIINKTQKERVEHTAQTVLDIRTKYSSNNLATLYNKLTMPPDLLKAHQALDKAVDKCYCKEPFNDERERIEFLFGLYDKYTNGLLIQEKVKSAKKKASKK